MFFSASAQVPGVNLQAFFESPQVVGQARLKVFFFNIYDAVLFAPQGNFEAEQPFALKLKYLRDFEGKEIASRSVGEMRNLGMQDEVKLAKWYQEMQDIFPNVKEGETITGIVDKKQVSHFYLNEKPLGKVHDIEFSKWFFNIWLSEETSEPKMRQQLLGLVK
ncbi:MAG: hypothetical protein ACJAVV_003072 [Alphaproteobacteria bacterium]|jgi:hypothetical protein